MNDKTILRLADLPPLVVPRPQPRGMVRPRGAAELRERYGWPELDAAGQLTWPNSWERRNMVLVRHAWLPRGKLYVHRDAAAPLVAALDEMQRLGYRVETIGCWNVRPKRTAASDPSVHSWGLAVDVNAARNPLQRRPASGDLVCDMPPAVILALEACGWVSGARWGRRAEGERRGSWADPQHLQLVDDY